MVLTDWEGQLGEVEGCEGELINELGISRKSELKFGVPPLSWGGDAPIILQGVDLMKGRWTMMNEELSESCHAAV